MKSLVLGICFILFMVVCVRAEKVKFAELTKEEFNTNTCKFYPEAKAVVLTKLGNIDVVTSGGDRYSYLYGEGMRIKILDDAKKDLGNIKIQFYSRDSRRTSDRNQEKIYDITGCTYNLENGNIVKEELEKSNIFTKRLNDRWVEVSFVLPNVKKGSVIEYSYTKKSPYIENPESWYFQMDIPVCYNELVYTFPECFNFQARTLGELYHMEREVKSISTYMGNESVSCQQVRVVVRDVLPVEEEPFVCNPGDLPMRMEFQLVTINYPGLSPKHVAGTYEKFNKQLLENDRFWKVVSRDRFPDDFKINNPDMGAREKVVRLLEQMRKTVVWNKAGGYLSSEYPKDCLKDKSGNVGDINLTLTALFRANGLEAYPVILSTRGHGAIHPVYPNYNDFNYVVAAVNIDGKVCFCDATTRGALGLLPPRCLNGNGWVVTESGGSLVPLKGGGIDVSNAVSIMRLKGNKMEVTVDLMNKEYAAMQIMENYEHLGAQKYQESLQDKLADWKLTDYVFQVKENDVSQSFKLEKPCEYTDVMYVQPFLYGVPSEPLFKRNTRNSDVDFPYGIQQRVTTTVIIPEGYEVEQLPEEINRSLSDNGALFAFEAFQGNAEVTFSVTLMVRKLTYTSKEYSELKDFFEQFTDLSKVMLVLKKKV